MYVYDVYFMPSEFGNAPNNNNDHPKITTIFWRKVQMHPKFYVKLIDFLHKYICKKVLIST